MRQFGEYSVTGVLGEGGMATVYEAVERTSQRPVALKVLEAGLGASPRVRQLFVAEMAILDRINHPNVVRLLGSSEIDGQLVMVLELLRGETLRDRIRRCLRLPWSDAVAVLRQVLAGLWAAHSQHPPVVHRDLKPENVMIATGGIVKVMDFGIAKVIREGTMATTDVGTLAYMSPEQIEGVAIDQRADLYNAGLILYEMLTGAPPFHSQSTRELLNAQCTSPPPPLPPDVAATVPASLLQLMLQLLAKSPHERPSSAGEVTQRLDAIVQSPGPAAIGMGASTTAPWSGAAGAWSGSAVAHPASLGIIAAPVGRPPPRSTGSAAVVIAVIVILLGIVGPTIGWMIFTWYSVQGMQQAYADGLAAPAEPLPASSSKTSEGVARPPESSPSIDRNTGRVAVEPSRPAPEAKRESADPGVGQPDDGITVEPTAAARKKAGAIACLVEGRTSGTLDLVILVHDLQEPAMEWLDGQTGETYRTLALEKPVVYCVAPHVLGVVREKATRLDLIDVASGDVLSSTTVESGITGVGRKNDRARIGRFSGGVVEVPVPGCKSRGCGAPWHLGGYGSILETSVDVHNESMCAVLFRKLEHGGVRYETAASTERVLLTATRGRKKLWSTLLDLDEGKLPTWCPLAADDRGLAVLRIDERDDTEIELLILDLDTGSITSELTVVNLGPRTKLVPNDTAVSAFFRANELFFLFRVSGEIIAFDPAAKKIAWRR